MTASLPTYAVESEMHLGPAMRALSPMMRQFVLALIQTGCSNAKAAELAGYQGGPDTWKSMGWKLAHDARVQAALHEEAQKLIRSTAVMAIRVITDIAKDPEVDPKARLKAATELLNRSGLHPTTEHKLTVERVPGAGLNFFHLPPVQPAGLLDGRAIFCRHSGDTDAGVAQPGIPISGCALHAGDEGRSQQEQFKFHLLAIVRLRNPKDTPGASLLGALKREAATDGIVPGGRAGVATPVTHGRLAGVGVYKDRHPELAAKACEHPLTESIHRQSLVLV